MFRESGLDRDSTKNLAVKTAATMDICNGRRLRLPALREKR